MNTVPVITKHDVLKWRSSRHISGWEYVPVAGGAPGDGGPYTLLCRCSPGVVYSPWISNACVEYLVLSGDLAVNGSVARPMDHVLVPPEIECVLSSAGGMEALCFGSGRVVWAKTVFSAIQEAALSDEDAVALLSKPWIYHLRRNIRLFSVDHLCAAIASPDVGPRVRELCISAARELDEPRVIEAAKAIIAPGKSPGLSMRVTCVLYLASKRAYGDHEGFDGQIAILASVPDELIEVTKSFYDAANRAELAARVEAQMNSKDYSYNEPFYRLLLTLTGK